MRRNNFFYSILFIAGLTLLGSSCRKETEPDSDAELLNILESYTNNTVIQTYKGMADKAMELFSVCQQVRNGANDANIAEACNLWRAARVYWEQSEAFLFGPAEYNSLDPHLDSWPLDKDKLDQVLRQSDIMNIDAAYARNNFGSSLLGFHAVEYVLFRDGGPRSSAAISSPELAYLCAIAQVLAEDCILLEGSWSGESSLSSEKMALLEEAELAISADFGYEMKNAGKRGSRYASARQAIEEIIEGCKDIADEVGNSKIADPVQSGNVLDVESWYSWNSIDDFVNNIVSIQNSYYGSQNGIISEHSLCRMIAENNPPLDMEIKANIENAKAKIIAIGTPFRNHLNNRAGAQAAMDACNQLYASINKINLVIP
ncbi:MAG: peptidase M75 [Bacteroidales bacterium]|jgi:predicted lipoprotein|nr:peptidase M75 [Bacteroidales bacterium]